MDMVANERELDPRGGKAASYTVIGKIINQEPVRS
jgi:hypothetical protein